MVQRIPYFARLSLLALLVASCGGGGGGSSSAKINAPGSGAVWGGTQTIRWVTVGQGPVDIYLSDDGGSSWSNQLAADTPDDGSHALDTTALTDDTDYRVKVVLGNGKVLRSGVFAIDNTLPTLSLIAPNTGVLWGAEREITWSTTDVHPSTVEIRLSADGGFSFDTVIAAAAPDTGTYAWDTSAHGDGTQYRVQIIATDEAGNDSAADSSGADFELDNTAPVVTLNAPNGGESWNGPQGVDWSTTETNPSYVTLYLSTDSGNSFPTELATYVPDTGSFTWGSGQAPDSSTLRLRVVATDLAGNESAPADSAADFTVDGFRLLEHAYYHDEDGDGAVNAGDTLHVFFEGDVDVNTASASAFDLAVFGDSFGGAGAGIAAGPESDLVIVTLGTSPQLRTRGTFLQHETSALSPSGFDVSFSLPADALEENGTGVDAGPSGWFDVLPSFDVVDLGPAVTSTSCVAAGDIDRDGDDDFVIGRPGGNVDQVYRNDGGSTFTLIQVVGAETTRSIALGDVDGDGDLDLVRATDSADHVWLNTGTGTFADSGQRLGSSDAGEVVLVDLDRDGDLDLYVGNLGTAANQTWINDGTGTYSAGQSLGSADTRSVVTGDVDGDGDWDVIAGNYLQTSRVWVNNGSGTLSAGPSAGVHQTRDMALGDLDGDGDLDLFVVTLGQNEVRLNGGSGDFSSADQFIGNNDDVGVALVDMDLDGDLDGVSAKNADAVRYWINDGAGSFSEARLRGTSGLGTCIAAGRFDADVDLDLILIYDSPDTLELLRSSAAGGHEGLGHLNQSTAITTSAATTCAAHGDVNGDGDLDVVCGVDGAGALGILSDGSGGFAASSITTGSGTATSVALADVDRDGDLDLIEGLDGGAADLVWLNDGSGGFTSSGLTLGSDATGDVVVGDVDSDGDVDLVTANLGGADRVWLGDGAGGFTDSGQALGSGTSNALALGDIDGDGDLDLVVARNSSSEVDVYTNNGTGTFVLLGSRATSGIPVDLALADLEGDTVLDLFVVDSSGAWESLTGDGSGGFTSNGSQGSGYQWIAPVYIDDDLNVDVVVATSAGVRTYLGDGAGGFSVKQTQGGGTTTGALVAADLDGDADVDIVRVGDAGATIVLWMK